jgi:sulfonate transport system permease protein
MFNNNTGKNKILDLLTFSFFPVALILLWFLATKFGWVKASIIPAPKTVKESLVYLLDKNIFIEDAVSSLSRILKGFVIGASVGIILGILVGMLHVVDNLTKVFIALFRPVPIIALIPLFILWMGIGEESKVMVIALGTFWALLINTIDGIKGVDKKLVELGINLGKSKGEIVRSIIFPAAFPSIYTGLRIGITSSIGFVITAEMIAASAGVGYRIMYARNMAMPGILFVGIIEIGLFGLVVDLLVLKLQKYLFRYR